MGGMDGFGPVRRETNEPVFHEPWEGRVFGMNISGVGRPPSTIDAGRHRIERLDPARYLASSYYERTVAGANGGGNRCRRRAFAG
jgi:nitrile hydratase subunit beta